MEPVVCTKFPGKKRYGRNNRSRATKDARRYQMQYRKNLRIYQCESCKGFHLTSESLKHYHSRKDFNNHEPLFSRV